MASIKLTYFASTISRAKLKGMRNENMEKNIDPFDKLPLKRHGSLQRSGRVNGERTVESIDELLDRSISKIYPSKEDFKNTLLSGKKLRIYIGADVTGPQLHLGHSVNYILLEKFRRLGHEVIVLFGDFTAMIGDPTDKLTTRKKLGKEEVVANMKTWKAQVSKLVNFKDKKNPPQIVQNSKWLSKLNFSQVVELAAFFTVQQMIERDMFQQRISDKKPIYLHEFLYPLMQGYDSVALDVDVEIGGTDQTFNMLVGRTLQEKLRGRKKFVVTTTLLENPKSGKKLMSKSEGVYVALNDDPKEMFGKVMALPDETIISVFTDCTYVSSEELEKVVQEMADKAVNPRDLKIRLAFEIVKIYHNEKAATLAQNSFIETFQKKEVPTDLPQTIAKVGEDLAEVIIRNGYTKSKSEYRRLLMGQAVHNLTSGEIITDPHFKISGDLVLKIGKKRFLKIVAASSL